MKKMMKLAGILAIVLLFSACQNSEDNSDDPNTDSTEENGEAETEEQNDNTNNENTGEDNDSNTYTEMEETSSYSIGSQYVEGEVNDIIEFYIAFSINRDEDQQLSHEDQIKMALNEGDPSEQDILNSYTDISIDWPELQLNFTGEGNDLSTTSTQSLLFYDSLIGISALYGIEEVLFLNSDGENDIIVAERGVDEPLVVDDERDLTRGYYTIYDEDLEETLFLTGGDLEEQVENEKGEPLTFSETIETMAIVDRENAFYSSAIVEEIEVVNTSMEDDIATVQYEMDEDNVSEADRIVFEKAIQLAALDFDAASVRLKNDSMQEVITYPLRDQ